MGDEIEGKPGLGGVGDETIRGGRDTSSEGDEEAATARASLGIAFSWAPSSSLPSSTKL